MEHAELIFQVSYVGTTFFVWWIVVIVGVRQNAPVSLWDCTTIGLHAFVAAIIWPIALIGTVGIAFIAGPIAAVALFTNRLKITSKGES